MSTRKDEEHELLGSHTRFADDSLDLELNDYIHNTHSSRSFQPSWRSRCWQSLHSRLPFRKQYHAVPTLHSQHHLSISRLIWSCVAIFFHLILILIVIAGLCFPSYTNAPAHYQALQKRVDASLDLGRANINNETVFIAASIYDKEGELISGDWGQNVLDLVDILGPENVHLSIYEDDPDPVAKAEMDHFAKRVTCNSSIVAEHLDSNELTHVTLPNGETRLKRIAFLAEVRNRALRPLDDPESTASAVQFDKLLYLNDVMFDAVDAANLLFSTNVAQDGKTQYRAACATDFINPFKFYDTFATRDLDGYSMGIPFFPWFPSKGNAQSRADVLAQTDAVRVRSCWGGMVAFEAKWFQSQKKELQGITTTQSSAPATTTTPSTSTTQSIDFHPEVDANLNWHLAPTPLPESGVLPKRSDSLTTPIRFRASPDLFWDASECCLIHADLQDPRGLDSSAPTGIYLNPYIRVAYDTQTLRWLPFTRRFERLYSPIHRILTWMVKLPGYNPRREEEAGQKVTDRVWVYNDEKWMETGNLSGGYRDVERTALPGGFCGSRKLLSFGEGDQRGKWWFEQVPKDELAPRE